VIDGYGPDEMCRSGRGQVLVPWPNRLDRGTYEWDGRTHRLPLNEPEHENAIHGLVRWVAWDVRERARERVVLAHTLHPQPGYPFSLDLELEYALSSAGLRVRTIATNAGREPCPYGAGAHPYVTVGTATVDGAILRVPAASVVVADDRGIPTGSIEVAGTDFDFRDPRAVGTTRLDHCFTGLVRDEDGIARASLVDAATGRGVELWVDEGHPYLMVFTGDPLPDVARRSVAIEPMTCAPNAFRSGEGLVVLDPGESFRSSWGIAPS
jgi:aldose 1-epimerase